MEGNLPPLPAKVRHKQLAMQRSLRMLQKYYHDNPDTEPDELNVDLTFEDGQWVFIIHTKVDQLIEEESSDVVIRLPYRLKGKRWLECRPQIVENGEKDPEFEGDLEDAIKKLMGGGGGSNTGDLTGNLLGGTGNKGFSSSDVRRVTVIRT